MKKNIGRKRKSKKGVALVVVIMLSMVMMIIVGVILKLGQMHYHSSAHQLKRTKAFYLAQAGVEWAIYRCRTAEGSPEINGYEHTVSTPEGDVTVTIDIKTHSGSLGVDWDIVSKVDFDDVRLK